MTTAAGHTHSVAFDPEAQRVIEERRARRLNRLARRDRATLIGSVALFLTVAGAMAMLIPSERNPSVFTVALLLGAYAVAFRLDFEISSGSAVPTQLILVPMLFLLPIGMVPLAVAAGVLSGSTLEYVRGSLHPERVFLRLLNAWHAVGPALILGIAGESAPNLNDWPIYVAA